MPRCRTVNRRPVYSSHQFTHAREPLEPRTLAVALHASSARWARRVIVALFAAAVVGNPAHAAITVSVRTDKPKYHPGEALNILTQATNTDPNPVILYFPSTCQSQHHVDEASWFPDGGLQIFTQVSIPGNAASTWIHRYPWRPYPGLKLGTHDLFGRVVGYGSIASTTFQVTPPTLPKSSFLVNFDTLPGAQTPIQSLTEYWQYGIRFQAPLTLPWGQNRYLPLSATSHAELDVPTRGATVDVTGPVGRTVTLIARALDGSILHTAQSPPLPGLGQFVTLAVESPTPIARLTWEIAGQGEFGIDNLYVQVPEPPTIFIAATAMLLRRRLMREKVRQSPRWHT